MADAQTSDVTAKTNLMEIHEGTEFMFAVDCSRSMDATDCPGGMSRIDYLKETLEAFIASATELDPDGVDVYTFGENVKLYAQITPDAAKKLIDGLHATQGATDTATLIQTAWQRHKSEKQEQTFLFIATDGEPTNKKAVQQAIVEITKQLKDAREFKICFLTVGVVSDGLSQWLTDLDENLKGAAYDIVHVSELATIGSFMQAAVAGLE